MLRAFASLWVVLSWAVVLLSVADASLERKTIDDIAWSKQWLKLLHYRKGIFSWRLKSQVDGPEFFFSPEGKTNPKAELVATLEAFSKDIKVGRLKQHPQCAFPERFQFLKNQLQFQIKEVACPELQEYLAKFNAKSATLAFSSAFPNNPGSMFGHTFLRLNSSGAQKKIDLLDQGLSFAAVVPPEDGGLEFAIRGLGGGYLGQFAMIPYYAKVNEYINSESRDIWEYDLNLTGEQTLRLLRHVWEIETNSWFDYYFFDENCAYQLMALLEVANPEWDGIADWGIYVIPGETTKRLMEVPGRVSSVKFRPSLRKQMLQKFEALGSQERSDFFKILEGKKDVSEFQDPLLLETIAHYLYYLKQKNGGTLAPEKQSLLKTTLLKRSELGEAQKTGAALPPIAEDTRPDLGHNTYRLGALVGANEAAWFQELQFKFAFHDLLNNDLGYIRYSQIDFPSLTLRYYPSLKILNIEELTGLAITSLFPMTFLEKRPSWKALLKYESPKDFGCLNCHVVHGEVGAGVTIELSKPQYIFSLLGLVSVDGGSSLKGSFRGGPKLESMLLLNPIEKYKLEFAYSLTSDLFQNYRKKFVNQIELNQSFSFNQTWEIRSYFESEFSSSRYRQVKLALNYYF